MPTLCATLAMLLFGANYLFVRQASTEEVYILQLFFVLLATFFLLDRKHSLTGLGGVAFGCAVATHYGSLFLVPSMVCLVLIAAAWRKRRYFKPLLLWTASAMMTIGVFYAAIYFLLPKPPGGDSWSGYTTYLRGIARGVEPSRVADPAFLAESFAGLVQRLTSAEIPHGHGACATMPLGITWVHFVVAIFGAIVMWRIDWKFVVFWLLWSLPYLGYEILLGDTPDFGVYAVFLLPALTTFVAFAVAWSYEKVAVLLAGRTAVAASLLLAAGCLLLAPSFIHFLERWNDVTEDAIEHYSAQRLAAAAAAEVLPADAIVIQPTEEWNANLLPYYAQAAPDDDNHRIGVVAAPGLSPIHADESGLVHARDDRRARRSDFVRSTRVRLPGRSISRAAAASG